WRLERCHFLAGGGVEDANRSPRMRHSQNFAVWRKGQERPKVGIVPSQVVQGVPTAAVPDVVFCIVPDCNKPVVRAERNHHRSVTRGQSPLENGPIYVPHMHVLLPPIPSGRLSAIRT